MLEDKMAIPELLEQLYGRSKWKPILCFKTVSGHHVWLPKAQSGSTAPAPKQIERLGVWGGTVETYDVGFNQQPCELVFAAIDVDWNKQVQHSWAIPDRDIRRVRGETVSCDLARTCADIVPEAMVRRSTSGMGAHLFLILAKPILCKTKSDAQISACKIAHCVAGRLRAHQVQPDIVGHNQCWVWGGKNETIQDGCFIDPDPSSLYCETPQSNPVSQGEMEGDEVILPSMLGPMCREILETLRASKLINYTQALATTYRLHIKPVSQVLCNLLTKVKFPQSAGTRLDEPNCILSLSNGELKLFSFVEHRVVFNLPLGV